MKKPIFLDKIRRELTAGGPSIRTVESAQGPYLIADGKRVLNLCSNNYLGFAADPEVKETAKAAIDKYGVGTASVRVLTGTNQLHLDLEKKLAHFKHAPDCLVVTSGYLANMAAIQTVLGKDDIVISDELNHASIIDAIRLSGVKNKFIYKHKDTQDLEKKIKEAIKFGRFRHSLVPKSAPPNNSGDAPSLGPPPVVPPAKNSFQDDTTILIVTDGVFSMDGDIAPLPDIVAVAEEFGALVMVDDAHGEGVLGRHGRGIVDHFGLHAGGPEQSQGAEGPEQSRGSRVHIEVGTLSKAFGVNGGFITGSHDLISWYRWKARQFLFSNALSIPDTAALISAVDILEKSDDRVKKLWENGDFLKKCLLSLGFDIGQSETPITPIMIGDEEKARMFAKELFEAGVYATAITFPMVPQGKARIRLIPSCLHSEEDLNFGIEIIEKVAKKLQII